MPKIHDPLNRLAYGVHPYYTLNYCSPADWDANFGFLVEQGHPVIATEWCANTGLKGTVQGCCKGQSSEQMTEKAWSFVHYLGARRIGLVAWGIDAPGTIVTDITGTAPTTYEGFNWDEPPSGHYQTVALPVADNNAR